MQSEDKDVQTLVSRVFQQGDERTPPFAIEFMCRLGNMALNELDQELQWLASFVSQLRDLADAKSGNIADEACERHLFDLSPDLGDKKIFAGLQASRHQQAEKSFAIGLTLQDPLHDWYERC